MRRFFRWRLVTLMILVAVAALAFGGYRAAVVRRHHYRMMAVNYEIYLQDERLRLLHASYPSRSSKEESRNRSEFDAIAKSIIVHQEIMLSYRKAADSPTAWFRIHPVAQPCDCAYCTMMKDRTFLPRSVPLGRYQTP